jgi:hypothetical protein
MAKTRKEAQAEGIEQAFDEAIAAGDFDKASDLAAGHPDPTKHLALMERLHSARNNADAQAATDEAQDRSAGDAAPPPLEMPIGSAGVRMFALTRRPATLSNFNPRAERHGDETKPAADLKFEANLESAALDAFHHDLRRFLYCKVGRRDDDMVDAIADAPDLRFDRLVPPIKWGARFAGYRVRIHLGIGENTDADVVLSACDVNALTFAPQQGGTVIVGWRVQCHPDADAAGKLSMLVGSRVDVSLIPPEDGGEIIDREGGE